jgi:hypothetical protein
LPRSGQTEQPRASALGKRAKMIALKKGRPMDSLDSALHRRT